MHRALCWNVVGQELENGPSPAIFESHPCALHFKSVPPVYPIPTGSMLVSTAFEVDHVQWIVIKPESYRCLCLLVGLGAVVL